MLSISGLSAGYGAAQVLFGLDLSVTEGETVALMGRNGMGKTTTVRAIMGLLAPFSGSVQLHGRRLEGRRPHDVARAGIGLVPEGRQVFPGLTVQENLLATAASRHGPARWTLREVFALFPRLQERGRAPAVQLSGGEQQMLAIGRALMTNPSLLILDEATEGLAPLVRDAIHVCLTGLKREGLTILVIDKHLAALARLADRAVVMEKGRLTWEGPPRVLLDDAALAARLLHV